MVTYFGVFLVIVLLGSDPPANQVIAHGVRQGKIIVTLCGNISVFDKREVKVPVKVGFEVCDVLNSGKATHRNLLLLLVI